MPVRERAFVMVALASELFILVWVTVSHPEYIPWLLGGALIGLILVNCWPQRR